MREFILSYLCSTSSVHLPPQCPVSLQCCHPPTQEPSLCRFCHQEGDFSVSRSTWLQTGLPMQQCLGITCQLCCCTRNLRGAVHRYLHPPGCSVPGWCLPGCMGCEQLLSLRDLHCCDQGQQQFSQNEVWKLIAEPAPFLCLGNGCFWCRATDVKALQVDWGRDLVLSVFGGFDFSCVSDEN